MQKNRLLLSSLLVATTFIFGWGCGRSSDSASEKSSLEDLPSGVGHAVAHAVHRGISLSVDFTKRDAMPQSDGTSDSHGPRAATYPSVTPPSQILGVPENPVEWKRDRIIVVADKFKGLPYAHYHIPSAGGLDCSNYTSWVYNYAGIKKFSSAVETQGQNLLNDGAVKIVNFSDLKKGDLIYIHDVGTSVIGHAAIFIDSVTVIDSTSGSTTGRRTINSSSWYVTRFAYGVRVIL